MGEAAKEPEAWLETAVLEAREAEAEAEAAGLSAERAVLAGPEGQEKSEFTPGK